MQVASNLVCVQLSLINAVNERTQLSRGMIVINNKLCTRESSNNTVNSFGPSSFCENQNWSVGRQQKEALKEYILY